MSVIASVRDPAQLSAIMQMQAASGFAFRNEVYRGALAGEYRIAEVMPGGRVPAPMLWPGAPPLVVIIGDDGGRSDGPGCFPQARRLIAWADRAMLHATGGTADHYALVAAAARAHPRVLLIETNTQAEAAWRALLEEEIARRDGVGRSQLAVLIIQVPPGRPAHPTINEPVAGGVNDR